MNCIRKSIKIPDFYLIFYMTIKTIARKNAEIITTGRAGGLHRPP